MDTQFDNRDEKLGITVYFGKQNFKFRLYNERLEIDQIGTK